MAISEAIAEGLKLATELAKKLLTDAAEKAARIHLKAKESFKSFLEESKEEDEKRKQALAEDEKELEDDSHGSSLPH